jgi:trimethylamine--corrinoid protein Co-methyltransferase
MLHKILKGLDVSMGLKKLRLEVLSSEDVEKIHYTSLWILEKIGIQLPDEPTLKALDDYGAIVDYSKKVAKIGSSLVEEMLRYVPACFIQYARNPKNTLTVNPQTLHFATGNALNIIEGKKSRRITKQDLANYMKLADAIPSIHFCVGTGISDVNQAFWDIYEFEIMLNNTSKHVRPVIASPKGCKAVIEMAKIVAGGDEMLRKKPILSVGYVALPPLRWSSTALYVFRETAPYNIPVNVESEPMTGATSPMTLAGTIAQANAEVLAGIVVNQIFCKGRPCAYSIGFTHTLDCKTAQPLSSSPEALLIAAAGAQLSKFYKIPSLSWVSCESKVVDAQSAYEKAMSITMHAISGNNIIWGMGSMEFQSALSLEQTLLDAEIAEAITRIVRGIDVSSDTLALDVIESVGIGGNYLASKHTREYYTLEHIMLSLTNRESRGEWMRKGSLDMSDRLKIHVKKILDTHQPEPLDEDIKRQLKQVIIKVEKGEINNF